MPRDNIMISKLKINHKVIKNIEYTNEGSYDILNVCINCAMCKQHGYVT